MEVSLEAEETGVFVGVVWMELVAVEEGVEGGCPGGVCGTSHLALPSTTNIVDTSSRQPVVSASCTLTLCGCPSSSTVRVSC